MEFPLFNTTHPFKPTKETEIHICQAYSYMNGLKQGHSSKRDCRALLTTLGFNMNDMNIKKLIEKMTNVDSLEPCIPFDQFYGIVKGNLVWKSTSC